MKLQLANSAWPRTGRDLRNSALSEASGPSTGEILLDIPLPISGSVVLAGGERFLVSGEKTLLCLSGRGKILWRKKWRQRCSASLALAGGRVLINLVSKCVLLDEEGELVREWGLPDGYGLDDSGPYPAVLSEHPNGWIALSTGKLRLLTRSGVEAWVVAVPTVLDWGLAQAACDSHGRTYVPCRGGVAAFDQNGAELFRTSFGEGYPGNVALSDRVAALIHDKHLVVLG